MTNLLLTSIAVLLLARVILQIHEFRRIINRSSCTTINIQRVAVTGKTVSDLCDKLCDERWYPDYVLVAVTKDKGLFYAFLESREFKKLQK